MTMSGPGRSIPPPPRLSVLLAAQAPVGIVFRRGPSRIVRVIHWDRTKDEFTPGATFKGRIYADRSDISPDGRHMLYFAMGGAAWAIAGAGYTWTAISEAPSVTALSLWGQGDTRGGGGYFRSNGSYWLESDGNTSLIRDNAPLRRGHTTVHERWNKNAAILSGDVMLVEGYKLMMQVDVRVGKGVPTLESLLSKGEQDSYDFAFVGEAFMSNHG